MTNYVRLRGLPFSAKEDTVREFLKDVNVLSVSLPVNRENRPSGEAFCGLKRKEDLEAALKLHKQNLSNRYIEE